VVSPFSAARASESILPASASIADGSAPAASGGLFVERRQRCQLGSARWHYEATRVPLPEREPRADAIFKGGASVARQPVFNGGEGLSELRAHRRNSNDDHYGDQRGDKTIFDGSCAFLIVEE
jgi:hypothetical protein